MKRKLQEESDVDEGTVSNIEESNPTKRKLRKTNEVKETTVTNVQKSKSKKRNLKNKKISIKKMR